MKRFITIITVFSLLVAITLTGCEKSKSPDPTREPTAPQGQTQTPTGEDTDDTGNAVAEPQIRVFENGNANVKLFPDGTFIANLFHNTKITGHYTQVADPDNADDFYIEFIYNGVTTEDGFEAAGRLTLPSGIVNGVLTVPEEWADEHDHGLDYTYRGYPLVFADENGQSITLYSDSSFVASFANDVTITGLYGMRATSVTFVPGGLSFNSSGELTSPALVAHLITDDDDHDHGHDETGDHTGDHTGDETGDHTGDETGDHTGDETGDHTDDDDDHEVELELPDEWLEAGGDGKFILQ